MNTTTSQIHVERERIPGGVRYSIFLPATDQGALAPEFVRNYRFCEFSLNSVWGRPVRHNDKNFRMVRIVWAEPTIEASEAAASAYIKEQLDAMDVLFG